MLLYIYKTTIKEHKRLKMYLQNFRISITINYYTVFGGNLVIPSSFSLNFIEIEIF